MAGFARRKLAWFGVAPVLVVALLGASAGSPAAGASFATVVGGKLSAPDSAAKRRLSACAKAKVALRKAKTKKAKAKASSAVKRACKKPLPTVKNVSLTLDTGRAATRTVGAQGGSITATSGDGTTFTLVLPADALVGATEIKLIPVTSVMGLAGRARVVGAVQLEPDGLGLFKPATLTITSPSLTGKPTQAFGWYGTGRAFHRYPSTRTATGLELTITHFSGDGVAEGQSTDWSRWQSLVDATRLHYQQSVRPRMTQAETDDSALFRAVQDYLGWSRQISLLGIEEQFSAELAALAISMEKGFRNYVEKASERCVNQHKLGEVTVLVLVSRSLMLLGHEQLGQQAWEKAKKCAHFELDFETVITRTMPAGPLMSEVKLESRVRAFGLKLNLLQQGAISGEKQIEYLSWSYTGTAKLGDYWCSYTPEDPQLGDPFVASLLFDVRMTTLAGPDGRPQFDPPEISAFVFPGKPTESVAVVCADDFRQGMPAGQYYHDSFATLYSGQKAADSFRIGEWDILGGSVYARKTYVRTHVSTGEGVQITTTERTAYDLRHTPLP